MSQKLLEVKGLKKYFPIRSGFFKKTKGFIKAVDDVSFNIDAGETLGLVGESGCGKTTTGRLVLRLLDRTAGEIDFHHNGQSVDLTTLQGEQLRDFRQHIQLIFQDPYASLNPRMTVRDIVAEPMKSHGIGSRSEMEERVRWLMEAVGLNVKFLNRYPHAFSGGQRQRIGIARALALNPKLIVCDEPVSALDVSVQAQIINLLKRLQKELGLAYLFIAHDLSVVENISRRVAVMYAGRIVELAEATSLFNDPQHPYTEALMSALPQPDPKAKKRRIILSGEVADPSNLPSGCSFHPRCRFAQERCKIEIPELREIKEGHLAACHFSEELQLSSATAGVDSSLTADCTRE